VSNKQKQHQQARTCAHPLSSVG